MPRAYAASAARTSGEANGSERSAARRKPKVRDITSPGTAAAPNSSASVPSA